MFLHHFAGLPPHVSAFVVKPSHFQFMAEVVVEVFWVSNLAFHFLCQWGYELVNALYKDIIMVQINCQPPDKKKTPNHFWLEVSHSLEKASELQAHTFFRVTVEELASLPNCYNRGEVQVRLAVALLLVLHFHEML